MFHRRGAESAEQDWKGGKKSCFINVFVWRRIVYRILDVLKFFVVFLLMCVMVGVMYLGIVFFRGGSDAFLTYNNQYTLETFLAHLKAGNFSRIQEHQRLYKILQAFSPALLSNAAAQAQIPYDYRYFVQDVAPGFLRKTAENNTLHEDPNILQTFSASEKYAAQLVLLSGDAGEIARGKRMLKSYAKRLEMAGTYTSEFDYPTGLFIIDGEVLNPALQSWDGLVILDRAGRLHITDIRRLEYGFQRYDLAGSHDDFLAFLKIAAQERLSIFQTHLLITSGDIDASPEFQRRFRRRAIFQDARHRVAVYDSLNETPTLYELAETLKTRYGATEAVNLDMGPYGYCARYEYDKRVKLYFPKRQGIRLSNILVFNYN